MGFLLLVAASAAGYFYWQNSKSKNQIQRLQEEQESLSKYKPIVDVESHIEKLKSELEDELVSAKAEIKKKKEEADSFVERSRDLARKIESDANQKAEEIAGAAWEAKSKAKEYMDTVKTMKNIIDGYGDEYLVPNRSVLDDLAAEYDHKEAGQKLADIRALIKKMIKNNEVATCEYKEELRKKTAIAFVTDAFNGKVDTIMTKVKHDNYGELVQQLQDAVSIVNANGQAFKNAQITNEYFKIVMDQLKMAVAVQEIKRIDQEEQKRIKDQIREEEKARKEYEKALREAEKEEKALQKAMKEAEQKLASAADAEREKFQEQIAKLQEKLAEAEKKEERALSMAQQTKRGHVYIISNEGSFGENVFKIGLTRRLEPMDRVKELGDASVPFSFDVHAMIYSEDAPALENELHNEFQLKQVNKVNPRKEFFDVSISDIKSVVESLGHKETHWTIKAEAAEYRQSLELAKQGASSNPVNDEIKEAA